MNETLQVEESLPELVARVHRSRLTTARLQRELTDSRQKWEAENAELIEHAKQAGVSLADVEGNLRLAIVAEYERTGNKAPADGCGVRVTSRYDYDEKVALSWATDHGLCLKLDTKAFGEVCKTESMRPNFVTVEEVPTATIATDLSKFVGD